MDQFEQGPNQDGPNDRGGTARTIGYSYGGEYVINSSASAGAWIASTHAMLDIDQLSAQEVA